MAITHSLRYYSVDFFSPGLSTDVGKKRLALRGSFGGKDPVGGGWNGVSNSDSIGHGVEGGAMSGVGGGGDDDDDVMMVMVMVMVMTMLMTTNQSTMD